jgi:hypothetical protein
MVQQRDDNELQRAYRLVQQAEERYQKTIQKVFFEAAKQARKLRLEGRLSPFLVIDGRGPPRYLRRN